MHVNYTTTLEITTLWPNKKEGTPLLTTHCQL